MQRSFAYEFDCSYLQLEDINPIMQQLTYLQPLKAYLWYLKVCSMRSVASTQSWKHWCGCLLHGLQVPAETYEAKWQENMITLRRVTCKKVQE